MIDSPSQLSIHFRWIVCLFILLSSQFAEVPVTEAAWSRPTHHALEVTLDPATQQARMADLITLYPFKREAPSVDFYLHANYRIEKTEIPHKGRWRVETSSVRDGDTPLQKISVFKPDGQPWPDFVQIKFLYSGKFYDPLRGAENAPPSGGEKDHGIFLSGAGYFYPSVDNDDQPSRLTFSLAVNLPSQWKVVSQGKRVRETTVNGPRHTFWQCDDPMEEIFLIADHYVEYRDQYEDVTLYVFLRKQEKTLARKYLDAAKSYIAFYERLIGSYPFVKFAVVENALQTGYGMPSFTLLGSRVIRFPFILHTSYPHEILHNWWGNGVYVDPREGNWSEGLTAYLSDHLFPDLDGNGPRYRFQELMKYSSYVNANNDFPLSGFTSRTDMATQAIGYGKLIMVLNMLRLEVGDAAFLKALQEFFLTSQFRHAGFEALRGHFEAAGGKNLERFFRQWIRAKGAPELELTGAAYENFQNEYRIALTVSQKQERPLYHMTLPVAVWVEGSDKPHLENLILKSQPKQTLRLFVPGQPRAVMLDPYYDVFRKLDPRETPPSIGQTYGADKAVAVISRQEEPSLRQAYTRFVEGLRTPATLTNKAGNWKWPNTSLWLFGRDNPAARDLQPGLKDFGVSLADDGVTIEGKKFPWQEHSFMFTLPHPNNPGRTATWIIADNPPSVPGLMRKLPHYGKYGVLVFKGNAPTNVYKNTWPARRIGLMKMFKEGKYKFPKRPPLVDFKPE